MVKKQEISDYISLIIIEKIILFQGSNAPKGPKGFKIPFHLPLVDQLVSSRTGIPAPNPFLCRLFGSFIMKCSEQVSK